MVAIAGARLTSVAGDVVTTTTVGLKRNGAAGPNGVGGRLRDVVSAATARAGISLAGDSDRVVDAAPRSAEGARVLGG